MLPARLRSEFFEKSHECSCSEREMPAKSPGLLVYTRCEEVKFREGDVLLSQMNPGK
jgi:hypothetical protein